MNSKASLMAVVRMQRGCQSTL